MKTNVRELQYSARRYWLSENGTIYNSSNEKIPTFLKDGHVFVKLSWINGLDDYKLATLMLITYKKTSLPDHLLERIEPLYIDNDPENLSVQNILYRFSDGPIEVEDIPGFYYVPLFANYAINKKGEIVNWRTKKYKVWSFTKPVVERNALGGYAYNRVVNDEGFSVTLFRHRAICLTFQTYGSNVNSLVVNHKDGVPGNDWSDNLELVTYQENNVHAFRTGLRNDNKPVLSKDLRTGEIKKFNSSNECAQHYGYPQGCHVRYRILSKKVHSDFIIFKDDDGTAWPEYDLNKVKIHIAKNANFIIGRNVFTGDFIRFSGTAKGSEATGVKEATILKHAKEDRLIPINGWNFRYEHKETKWPEHTRRHLIIYETYPIYPPDGLIAFNLETNEEVFFPSVARGSHELKINKHLIFKAIKEDKAVQKKWKFKLFDIRKNLGQPTE